MLPLLRQQPPIGRVIESAVIHVVHSLSRSAILKSGYNAPRSLPLEKAESVTIISPAYSVGMRVQRVAP